MSVLSDYKGHKFMLLLETTIGTGYYVGEDHEKREVLISFPVDRLKKEYLADHDVRAINIHEWVSEDDVLKILDSSVLRIDREKVTCAVCKQIFTVKMVDDTPYPRQHIDKTTKKKCKGSKKKGLPLELAE